MSHERFHDLAATALDFDLEPSERAELDAHLEACDACTAYVEALRRDTAWLRALPAPGSPPRVRRAVLGEQPGRRGTGQRYGLVIAIIILVLLPLGSATVLLRGIDLGLGLGSSSAGSEPPTSAWVAVEQGAEPGPGASAAPGASGTSAPTFPPSTAAAGSGAPGTPGAIGDVQGLAAVSWSPGFGFVAVGDACPVDGDGCAAAVVLSADGRTWERVRDPALALDPLPCCDRTGMRDVTVLGKRIIAVGSGAVGNTPQAALWWSDTGSDWTRVPYDASTLGWANAVATLGSGRVVAVGAAFVDGGGRAVAWTSADGATWQRAPDAPSLDVGISDMGHDGRLLVGMQDVASDGRRLVAVGVRCNGPDGPCSGAGWTSTDGVSWSVGDRSFGTGLPFAVAAVGGQFVAVGREADLPAAWTSVDGLTWQPMAVDEVPGAELRTVIDAGGVAMAGGWIDGSPATGSIWQTEKGILTLAERDGVFGESSVDGLARSGDPGTAATPVIAVGRGRPGELGTIWRREPEPEDQP